MLEDEKWRKVSWRRGTKGRLNCQFAAIRVRIADGHRHRMADGRVQAMPGDEEIWLIGERRATGERKYYASNLPADTPLKALATASRPRDGKKRSPGPPPQPTMPAVRQAILDAFAKPPPIRCPHCEKLIVERPDKNLPK